LHALPDPMRTAAEERSINYTLRAIELTREENEERRNTYSNVTGGIISKRTVVSTVVDSPKYYARTKACL
jgi:uroporphyrinogen-III decarboxylase